MDKIKIEGYIEDVIVKIKSKTSRKKIKEYLKGQEISPLDMDRVLTKSDQIITKEFTDNAIKNILSGGNSQTLVKLLSENLSDDYSKMIYDQVVAKYKNEIKPKVIEATKTSEDYTSIVDRFTNEFITEHDIKSWIINYYKVIRKSQISKKKNEFFIGLGLTILGIGITIASYSISIASGGTRYLLTYGVIISGIIAVLKSLSITPVKVPDI